jgi:hypothetical protein
MSLLNTPFNKGTVRKYDKRYRIYVIEPTVKHKHGHIYLGVSILQLQARFIQPVQEG